MAMFRRRRWPYAAAAAVVVAALVAGTLWLVADRDGDGGNNQAGRTPTVEPTFADPLDASAYDVVLTPPVEETTPPPEPIAIDLVLAAPDAELKTYADQSVRAAPVNVLRRVDGSVAWVGDSPQNRLVVLLVATENPFTFGSGAKLTFDGVVSRAGPGFGKQLGLTGEELADFERQGTYIEITAYQQA